MRSSRLLTSAVVVLFVALVAVWLAPRVTAQSEARKPQKWEYCATYGGASVEKEGRILGTAFVSYLRVSGVETEKVAFELDLAEYKKGLSETDKARDERIVLDSAKSDARTGSLAKAIAKLGDEGWEMIGESTFVKHPVGTALNAIYFKRPK